MYIYTHIHTHSGSFAAAQALISANAQREASFDIDLRFQAAHFNVLTGVLNEGETVDFCMCNPPFFASAGAPSPPHLTLPTPSPLDVFEITLTALKTTLFQLWCIHNYSALPTLILVCPLFFFTLGLEWESFMLADIVGCF